MKICWDDLEGIYLSENGNFIKWVGKYRLYLIYKESCSYCGEPYFTKKKSPSNFCGHSCANSGKNNGNFGKPMSINTKLKLSRSHMGKKLTDVHKINIAKGAPKGGVIKDNVPLYSTYEYQLNFAEKTRFIIDEKGRKLLEIKCTKCGKWHVPNRAAVKDRIRSLNGGSGENRFYCSQECKDSCEIYRKNPALYLTIDNIDDINTPYTAYELSVWSNEVLTRADNKCEYCGKEAKHAHHIEPKKLEPGIALDPDNGLACCVECHYKYGHKDGCSTNNIRGIRRNRCK